MADAKVCMNSGVRGGNNWRCEQVYVPFAKEHVFQGFCPWCVLRTLDRHILNAALIDRTTVWQACEDQAWLRDHDTR
jgi:hypothetical protein